MAYIGREPQIGNFQVCDTISVVNNQAAYTMQVDSVNVLPETANHMLVSLNGILQAPTTSYTVSGATITFAANLVTGDVINFIQILGSVLDLGVPSDATVSLAKLTATGTKSSSTFLRGDNTFATPAAELNTPSFYGQGAAATAIANATLTKIAARTEIFDDGGCYNNTGSSTTLNSLTAPADCFTPNVAGLYYFVGAIKLNTANFNVGLVNNIGGVGGSEAYAALAYGTGIANDTIIVSGYSLMNGSGNNVCLVGYQESGGSVSTNDAIYTTYFGGFLVKKS